MGGEFEMTPQIWTETEKAGMRQTAEYYMADVGFRLVWSVVIDSVGDDIESYTQEKLPTVCGIEFKEGKEYKDNMTNVIYDATIRVPASFVIEPEDHFRITLFRGDVVDWEFEIVSAIQYGITAKRFHVRKVTH